MVGDDGIEPPQRASKAPALPLCKSPVKEKPTSILNQWAVIILIITP